jgi:hypothetical protein
LSKCALESTEGRISINRAERAAAEAANLPPPFVRGEENVLFFLSGLGVELLLLAVLVAVVLEGEEDDAVTLTSVAMHLSLFHVPSNSTPST